MSSICTQPPLCPCTTQPCCAGAQGQVLRTLCPCEISEFIWISHVSPKYDAFIYFGDTCEMEIFRIQTFRMFMGESCPIQRNVKSPIYSYMYLYRYMYRSINMYVHILKCFVYSCESHVPHIAMSGPLCIHTCICIDICIHVWKHVCIHKDIHVYTCTYTHTPVYCNVKSPTNIYVCIYM